MDIVDNAFHVQAVDISCGYYHSALVTEAGEVWTWGEGEGGKLGQGAGCDDCDTPRYIIQASDWSIGCL